MRFETTYFKLKFRVPYQVGHVILNYREGYTLSLFNSDKLIGCGEIAPLPGLHLETFDEITNILAKNNLDLLFHSPLPSILFGIESALHADALLPPLNIESPIESNYLFHHGREIPRNFNRIKVKIGRATISKDIEAILNILKNNPKAKLRLDGNRTLSLDDLEKMMERIPAHHIDYFEEPLFEMNQWNQFYKKHQISLALDEELQIRDPFFYNGVKAWVIKPSLFGLQKTVHMIDMAIKSGFYPVVSSTLDGKIGIEINERIATLVNERRVTVHGLLTKDLFVEEI